jgi:hypothetical protein
MVLWAVAIAPIMQKANDTTQSLHIGLNIMNLCMFIWQVLIWQVPMGLEIVLKVLKFLMYQIHWMILVFSYCQKWGINKPSNDQGCLKA